MILSAAGIILFLIVAIAGIINSKGTTGKSATRSSRPDASLEKPKMSASLPKAVNAGTAVAYANWEIVVSPELNVADNQLAFSFTLQNWLDSNQILTFEPNTIIVYDDMGKVYPLYLGRCAPDMPYLTRQLTFSAFEKMTFSSRTSWCSQETSLPTFRGVIPQEINNLYLHFESFGVFKNITFVFDL